MVGELSSTVTWYRFSRMSSMRPPTRLMEPERLGVSILTRGLALIAASRVAASATPPPVPGTLPCGGTGTSAPLPGLAGCSAASFASSAACSAAMRAASRSDSILGVT